MVLIHSSAGYNAFFLFSLYNARGPPVSLSQSTPVLPAHSIASLFLLFLCKPHAPGGKAATLEPKQGPSQPSKAAGVVHAFS